jgi:hypothetical protein
MATSGNTYCPYPPTVVANLNTANSMYLEPNDIDRMKIDFDLNAENIEKSEPATNAELSRFKEEIAIDLPPSFLEFKLKFADSFYVSTGNALSIFPLCENKDETTNIISISKDYAHLGDILDSHKLLIFGMSGVDSETWAFYMGKMYSNGEYPILWILPGEEKFFFHSSSFESFINVLYKSLTINNCGNDYSEYYKSLVEKYDKHIIPFGYDSIYSDAKALNDINLIMSKII